MDALVLAGGRLPPEFAQRAGQEVKALLDFRGRTLAEIVLRALREAPLVGRIVLIGPAPLKEALDPSLYDEFLLEGASGPENVFRGLEALKEQEQVVVSSSDLPLVGASAFEDMIRRTPPQAEVLYPYFRREEVEALFPGRRKTYIRSLDGTLTGGNALVLSPRAILRQKERVEAIFAARKKPLCLLRMFGAAFLLKGLVGRLRVADLERKASHIMGCRCLGLAGCSPLLALDVDCWEDWEYVQRWEPPLRERQEVDLP